MISSNICKNLVKQMKTSIRIKFNSHEFCKFETENDYSFDYSNQYVEIHKK